MYVNREEFACAQRAAEFLTTHEGIVGAALAAFAEQMTAAASQAQAAWEALRADPDTQRAHDSSGALVTVRGYQGLAEIWRGNAAAARAAQRARCTP